MLVMRTRNILLKQSLFCLVLTAVVGLNPLSVLADHQKKKSKEQILKIHEMRTNKIPSLYKTEIVKASNPIEFPNTAQPNAAVRKMMKNSELLSVLYFDGNSITADEANKEYNVSSTSKHYSMSISKSFVGYMLGHAICDGYIKNVLDPIDTYVPEAGGTVYQGESIRDLSNMTAKDAKFYTSKDNGNRRYTQQVVNLKGTKPIVQLLARVKGVEQSSSKKFEYHNIKSDLVARAVDVSVPGGFGAFLSEKLSKPAGFSGDIHFLRDKQGWPVGLSWFYLNRQDYLKFGIQVSKDWKAESCIGKYLRDAYANRNKSKNYGSFFWFESGQNDLPRVEMRGHGGQRVIINTNDSSVLTYLSMRAKYSEKDLQDMFLK